MRATRIGMFVLLVGAAAVTAVWLLARPAAVRYAGVSGSTSALVSLRVAAGQPAPEQVTVDVGNGVQIKAARLR